MASVNDGTMVPITGDAPAMSSNAGLTPVGAGPEEVDIEMQCAPVAAYFQYIQQNVQFVQQGSVDLLMAMAETRRREAMQEVAGNMSSFRHDPPKGFGDSPEKPGFD